MPRFRLARWQFSLRMLLITSSAFAVTLAGMRAVGFEQSVAFLAPGSCLLCLLGLILLLGLSCVRLGDAVEQFLK